MAAGGAPTGIAPEVTNVAFQRKKRVFHPGVADLFEALVVIGATAHAIKVLRNDRVISTRQLKPIHWLVAVVTRVCSRCQAYLCSSASHLVHALDFSNNDIGTWHKARRVTSSCAAQRWHTHGFGRAVNQLCNLNWLHRRTY